MKMLERMEFVVNVSMLFHKGFVDLEYSCSFSLLYLSWTRVKPRVRHSSQIPSGSLSCNFFYLDFHSFTRSGIRAWSYIIFVIFSPRTKFWAQFFPHRKCVNCDKTGFATKQRKFQKNRFCDKIACMAAKQILQQNSVNYVFLYIWKISTSEIAPHLKFLYI